MARRTLSILIRPNILEVMTADIASAQSVEIIRHVKKQRRYVDQAVDSV